jgi:NAD(P)-dependent dehydrogenase (short-subunit alcohol dehydrogenase family)
MVSELHSWTARSHAPLKWSHEMRLKDKIAIITGAAGGIGEAAARRFAAEGAKVMLVDVRDSNLAAIAASIGLDRADHMVADVSDPTGVQAFTARTIERFGGLDVMFANAGIEGAVGPLTDCPIETFDRILAVNVRGAFLSIRYAAPLIAARGGGAILVTSSVAGCVGSAGLGPYCATKHAVMGLVKCAAIELAPQKIRVVAINPGPIENRMMRSIESKAAPSNPESVKAGFSAMVPMHRYGTNEEIACLATFLASDEASYCTGSAYVADGGFLAQ